MCEYCREDGARSIAKKALEKIKELDIKIGFLESKLCIVNADNEYRLMMHQGSEYVPPEKSNAECDFVEVCDTLICTRCHKSFDNENFIPPYCPFCFAKREEV